MAASMTVMLILAVTLAVTLAAAAIVAAAGLVIEIMNAEKLLRRLRVVTK